MNMYFRFLLTSDFSVDIMGCPRFTAELSAGRKMFKNNVVDTQTVQGDFSGPQ